MTSLLHAYLIVSNGNLLHCVFASQMLHIRQKWTYQQSEFEILFKVNISLSFYSKIFKKKFRKKIALTNKVNCLFMWFPVTKTRSGNKRKKFRKFQGLHEIPDQFQEIHVIPKQYRNYRESLNFRNYLKSLITLNSCNIYIKMICDV